MKSKVVAAVLLFVLTANCCGWAQKMDDLKSCVTFVYQESSPNHYTPIGTAFFLRISDTVNKVEFTYIVTAKHVLWDTASKSFPRCTWIRMERTTGDLTQVRVSLVTKDHGQNTFTHPDTTVDLVAVQAVPDPEKYKYMAFPFDLIGREDYLSKIGIEEGADVVIPALFVPHIGEHENYPILRFGKLALMSGGERINWDSQLQRLHLIEAIAIGGHSGAPVFVWYHPFVPPDKKGMLSTEYTKKNVRLIGIVEGYFRDWKRTRIAVVKSSVTPVSEQHTGISAAVPVDLLSEILLGPEATKAREVAKAEFEKHK